MGADELEYIKKVFESNYIAPFGSFESNLNYKKHAINSIVNIFNSNYGEFVIITRD